MSAFAALQSPTERASRSSSSRSVSEAFYDPSVEPTLERGGLVAQVKEADKTNVEREHSGAWDNTGTRLFSITERSSVTTMKTLPPDATFQRHIISARQQIPSIAPAQTESNGSVKRRQCLSLDDQALHKMHAAKDL